MVVTPPLEGVKYNCSRPKTVFIYKGCQIKGMNNSIITLSPQHCMLYNTTHIFVSPQLKCFCFYILRINLLQDALNFVLYESAASGCILLSPLKFKLNGFCCYCLENLGTIGLVFSCFYI